jgi:hypothetical protein
MKTTITGTLQEDLHAFLCPEVTGFGIPGLAWFPWLFWGYHGYLHYYDYLVTLVSIVTGGIPSHPDNSCHQHHSQRPKVKLWSMSQNCYAMCIFPNLFH